MTRNEQQMYSNISSIAKSLEKIANALDNNVTQTTKDIPGFENTLNDLDNLYQPTSSNPDPAGYGGGGFDGLVEYETDLQEIRVDSDYDIRVAASNAEEDYATKKDAILDYVELGFGSEGARYTDIIKFAYYLGAHNAPKFNPTDNRGYYAMAFNTRFGGHLVQGGKDFLVKGINKNGKERYFAYNSVNKYTDYYKTIK